MLADACRKPFVVSHFRGVGVVGCRTVCRAYATEVAYYKPFAQTRAKFELADVTRTSPLSPAPLRVGTGFVRRRKPGRFKKGYVGDATYVWRR